MKSVATINPLGKENAEIGILSQIYQKIEFINNQTAAACYLNPTKYKIKQLQHNDLIYPFGCNASQKQAVATAFKNQISVIQGPPGTGKTQTILNIIANIVRNGKTVIVVSNNNSATANVQEKLQKYGLDFIVAPLGNRKNKDLFIENQPPIPSEIKEWNMNLTEKGHFKRELHEILNNLDKVYSLQRKQAELQNEQKAVELEWKHFCMSNSIDTAIPLRKEVKTQYIISQWFRYQSIVDGTFTGYNNFIKRIIERIRQWWLKRTLNLQCSFEKENFNELIKELQILYYQNRQREITEHLKNISVELTEYNADILTKKLVDISMSLFKASLSAIYKKGYRPLFSNITEIKEKNEEFTKSYPIILSTTFSAYSCLFTEKPYDYLIMDEASQVSIETGVLALACAKNAVIVGDTLQLPNVVTDEDKLKLNNIIKQYNIAEGYNCEKYSFLQSVCSIIKDVKETTLREHYRCHPRIINFCNQKFYGGKLIIMTKDNDESDVLSAVKTVKGNHASEQFNQREIDVIKNEVLPMLTNSNSIGIITPYNRQVEGLLYQIPEIETATIHKYQGREKDFIIMSVVDNQITPFADDANLLNVAISRAKNKFVLVITGNEQKQKGNLTDLIDYINYNNCIVTESKITSIFDYLYEQYTVQRIAFMKNNPKISQYTSENLTFTLINEVLSSNIAFSCLKVLCHIPLRQIIKDMSLMNEEEKRYALNYKTHVDFLIINRVTKLPILAIETDGYTFHNNKTEQYKRDLLKDSIFSAYKIPLLRLSTKGSSEKEKIIEQLTKNVSRLQ